MNAVRDLLTYRPPTADDLTLHRKLGIAQRKCQASLMEALRLAPDKAFAAVSEAVIAYGEAINEVAPDGHRKARAFEHLALARVAANEYLVNPEPFPGIAGRDHLVLMACEELLRARWLASASIAFG